MKDPKIKPPELGHVVEDYKIGNTRIIICDDYCRDKTKEEVDAILRRIAEIARPALTRKALKEMEEAE